MARRRERQTSSGDARPIPGSSPEEPRLSLRVEYVGVIAMLCFVLGAIVGSVYFGGARPTSPGMQAQGPPPPSEQELMERASAATAFSELVSIGNQAYDLRYPNTAIVAYEKALRTDSRNPDVLTDLGHMYLQTGRVDRAIDLFKRAAASDPRHAKSRFNLGIAYMKDKRDYTKAAEAFRECLRIDPNSEVAQAARAHLESIEKSQRKR